MNGDIMMAFLKSMLLLQVPWANLGRSPVLVSIDRLYILAGPKSEVSTGEEEQYEVAYCLSHLNNFPSQHLVLRRQFPR